MQNALDDTNNSSKTVTYKNDVCVNHKVSNIKTRLFENDQLLWTVSTSL